MKTNGKDLFHSIKCKNVQINKNSWAMPLINVLFALVLTYLVVGR